MRWRRGFRISCGPPCDAELLELAAQGQLRANLPAQVTPLLADKRSNEFVNNFVGQWLLARDVEGIRINERSVLARDPGQDREQERNRARFAQLRDIPPERTSSLRGRCNPWNR